MEFSVPNHLQNSQQQSTKENIDLYKASLAGSLSGVKDALSHGAKPDFFFHPDDQKNSLHVSAENGHLAIVKELLNHGAFVDPLVGTSQSTPLILACTNNHLEIVKVLMAAGANINAGNLHSTFSIHFVIY